MKDIKHDGHKVITTSQPKIPVEIGNKKCFIKTEIVKENISLLLSKTSLKKAGTVLILRMTKFQCLIKMLIQPLQPMVITQSVFFQMKHVTLMTPRR